MKNFTKKLSMKYVKLNKCRLRQDTAMSPEDDAGELFREISPAENEKTVDTINNNKTPKVTKIMGSMQRKFMSKEKKVRQEPSDFGADGHGLDQPRRPQYDGSTRRGRQDLAERLEGFNKSNGQDLRSRDDVMAHKDYDRVERKARGLTKSRSDFGSRKEYLDWIEYVEGSSHHCFERFEDSTRTRGFEEHHERKDGTEIDHVSFGQSEGSMEGNNDETRLIKSSKTNKNIESETPKRL
ncbi:PREDICTED: uncharacterized protein LOC104816467 [Tarenaya hassleriana]|uniref:uncharacterized protein LOC104816467 n=1 Tax=Tarenaya hassleriana TaxID=28532 RepID=UPI00053C30CE|nr:PREDICTED: uncharacterized protein LOC104816467 [Tarenaya hassleriana]